MVNPKTLQIATWSLLSPDWTVSTVRQALSPTGVGAIHKETKAIRKKHGRMFWAKAGLYFGVGIQLLNAVFRKKDEEENPKYYKEKKNKSIIDYTMLGNVSGMKTRLFVGRYKDGTERYIKWGKQFREIPELFIDPFKKIGGKASPAAQKISEVFTGSTLGGFTNKNIHGKKGWTKTLGRIKAIAASPIPFSANTLFRKDREFKPLDLMFPASKGMSSSKGIHLIKSAITISNKENRAKEIEKISLELIQNNIAPEPIFKAALSSHKAQNTTDINSNIRNIDDAKKALKKATSTRDRDVIKRKIKKIKKERAALNDGLNWLKGAIRKVDKYKDDL